jgi:chemotaxis regulatin CheY-phosphate phosphatase CheZ
MHFINDRGAFQLSAKTSSQHRLILEKLGRLPKMSLEAMKDYGLSDEEIGHYFHVTPSSVRRLRRVFERTPAVTAGP